MKVFTIAVVVETPIDNDADCDKLKAIAENVHHYLGHYLAALFPEGKIQTEAALIEAGKDNKLVN